MHFCACYWEIEMCNNLKVSKIRCYSWLKNFTQKLAIYLEIETEAIGSKVEH